MNIKPYLFPAPKGAIFKGLGGFVLALASVQRPQVLQSGRDRR